MTTWRNIPAFALAVAASAALAEQTLQVEEVTVTAQKVEASLQETPISLLAFDSDALTRQQISDLGDTAILAPNVTITPFPNSRSSLVIFMRGAGNNDSQTTQDPAVGVYIDGVYVGRSVGLTNDVADLERIEVLRGPQGTLYGRNTTAGAINMVTAKPTGEFGIRQVVRVGVDDIESWQSNTQINTGEANGFSAKLSYLASDRDGWVENTGAGEDFGENEKEAVRLALRSDNGVDTVVDYAFDYSTIDGPQHYYQNLRNPFNPNASLERQDSGSWDTGAIPSETRIEGHTLIVTGQTSFGELKSITSFRELDESIVQNYGAGAPAFDVAVDIDQEQFSQEVQVIGEASEELSYIVGAYYFIEESEESEIDNALNQTTFVKEVIENRQIQSENEARAVYAKLNYVPESLERKLDIGLGIRYTEDDRKATKTSRVFTTAPNNTLSDDESFSNVTGDLTFDYAWSDEVRTYAKYVTGYKAGGFNVRSTQAGFSPAFEEEEVESIELGLKAELFDRRLRLNAAAFYTEYDDLQIQQITDNSTIFLTDVFNAGEAEIDGFEIDMTAALIPGLFANLSYGYTNADITTYIDRRPGEPTEGQNIASQTFAPYAPQHTYTFGLAYESEPFKWGVLKASVDYSWTDERTGTAFNADQRGFFLDDYGLVTARVALTDIAFGDSKLEVAIWGKNLEDEEYVVHSISQGVTMLGPINSAYFGEPRTYGVEAILDY